MESKENRGKSIVRKTLNFNRYCFPGLWYHYTKTCKAIISSVCTGFDLVANLVL